jgi:hypothetical protein
MSNHEVKQKKADVVKYAVRELLTAVPDYKQEIIQLLTEALNRKTIAEIQKIIE